MKKKISVILPCHNESKNIPLLLPEIVKVIPKRFAYEIICVDDGSRDDTAKVISRLAKRNKKIKAIVFHRNFGHQAALRAGIQNSKGQVVITMDADFQHPPKVLPEMIKMWEKGFDLVQGQKNEDKTASTNMKLQRKVGYFVWSKITGGVITPGISDFRLMDRKVADYIKNDNEHDIFLRGVVTLAAKNPITVPYKVGKRRHGKSSYTFNMFFNMFANGFISFSTKPLRAASLMGLLLFVTIGAFIGFDIVRAMATGQKIIEGWVTGVVITVGLNGILMIYLGILGEYIGTIFKEVKRRPHYLIEKTINI